MSQEDVEKVLRISRLFNLAAEVFGNLEDVNRWFREPQLGLGNLLPIELLDMEMGFDVIEDLLEQIRYGVYS